MTLKQKVLSVFELVRGLIGKKAARTELAAEFSAYEKYEVGRLVVYEDELYRCVTAHTGIWNKSNFEKATVDSALQLKDSGGGVAEIPDVIDKSLTVNGDLSVTSKSYDNSEGGAVKALTVSHDGCSVACGGTLQVNDLATFSGQVECKNSITVDGAASVSVLDASDPLLCKTRLDTNGLTVFKYFELAKKMIPVATISSGGSASSFCNGIDLVSQSDSSAALKCMSSAASTENYGFFVFDDRRKYLKDEATVVIGTKGINLAVKVNDTSIVLTEDILNTISAIISDYATANSELEAIV